MKYDGFTAAHDDQTLPRLGCPHFDAGKDMTKSERELVAYHEAGHAVAAIRFGHLHARVSIQPDPTKGTLGHSSCEDDRDNPRENVIKLLAGYAAAVEAGEDEELARIGASQDFEEARDWLSDGAELPIHDARQFVRENWTAIDRVASELLKHGTLDGQVVEVLVDVADGESSEADLVGFYRLAGIPMKSAP